jgi:site-specific DNA-methyltransferase (adenine-specific)
MTAPYWSDDTVQLFHGDCREILPALLATGGGMADLVIADPPYAETSLEWDRWPDGWPAVLSETARSMWCFGSMRMFLDRRDEFTAWKLSQDIVWEKHNGSGFQNDRFKRVHEHALHWYQGPWAEIYHQTPTTPDAVTRQVRSKGRPAHMGERKTNLYVSEDGGPRLMRSVLPIRSMHGRAMHPTEKPVPLLIPIVEYGCPPGGSVLDPFAGSGSTAVAARLIGRKSVLIEGNEQFCEKIADRLAQGVLDLGGAA